MPLVIRQYNTHPQIFMNRNCDVSNIRPINSEKQPNRGIENFMSRIAKPKVFDVS